MHTYNHWITDIEQPTTATAFTYTIWFPELGQRYIGYKTISGGVNWLTYTSSSKPVKKLISNGHTAVYRIVKWFNSTDDAHKEEIDVMTSYDVTNRSEYLNQSIGGVKFSTAGNTHSSKSRAKMSASHKGKTLLAETRSKISLVHKGKHVSDETRAKLSAAGKARPVSDETRAKISAAGKGRSHKNETRAKISATQQNMSDETRAKMSASRKGKTHTDETRAKIRAANLIGLYVTPLGTFNTTREAAIANKCNVQTISNRCKSTSPQFDNWAFFKY